VQDYSPEQVVGTLKKGSKPYVSAERIYQYIWQNKNKKAHYISTYEQEVKGAERAVLTRIREV